MRIGVKSILEHKNACGKVSAKFLPILSVIDPKSPPFSIQKRGTCCGTYWHMRKYYRCFT